MRADEEMADGTIQKPMFERLILCEYAVADLTAANASVFYELGVRHAVRPGCTVLLFANQSWLPFDVEHCEITGFPSDEKLPEYRMLFARNLEVQHPLPRVDSCFWFSRNTGSNSRVDQ